MRRLFGAVLALYASSVPAVLAAAQHALAALVAALRKERYPRFVAVVRHTLADAARLLPPFTRSAPEDADTEHVLPGFEDAITWSLPMLLEGIVSILQ